MTTNTAPKPGSDAFGDIMTGKTMFRIGLALVVGAVAFFLRYSFQQGWIDPPVQLGMAAAVGLAMIVGGIGIVDRRRVYGILLQGAGGATLYLTAFAAHVRLPGVDLTTGFVLLATTSAAVVGLALRQRSEALAAIGLAGATAAPVLIGGEIAGFPGDWGYLLVVLATGGLLYVEKSWLWSFVSTTLGVGAVLVWEVAGRVVAGTGSPVPLQFGITGFWVIVTTAAVAGGLRVNIDPIRASVVPLVTIVSVPVLAHVATVLVWGSDLGPSTRILLALTVAGAHAAMWVILRHTRAASLVANANVVPVAVLAAFAWIDGLDGQAMLMAFSIQAAALIIIGTRRRLDLAAYTGHVVGIMTAAAWTIASFSPDNGFGIEDIFSAVVVVSAAVVALATRRSEEPHASLAQVYGGLTLPAALIWASTSLGPLPQGSGLVTGAWAGIGIITVVIGHLNTNTLVRNAGVATLLLSIGKLLLVDLATAHPLMRIGLFAGIGLAMAAIGYWLGTSEDETDLGVTGAGEQVAGDR